MQFTDSMILDLNSSSVSISIIYQIPIAKLCLSFVLVYPHDEVLASLIEKEKCDLYAHKLSVNLTSDPSNGSNRRFGCLVLER